MTGALGRHLSALVVRLIDALYDEDWDFALAIALHLREHLEDQP